MRAEADALTELPPRPEPPDPRDCCGSGCVRCIFDLYDDALAEWERTVARLREEAATSGPAAPQEQVLASRDGSR